MNGIEVDEKFKLFKGSMECLHDDFGLPAIERINRAYLYALAGFPESVRRSDSVDTYKSLSRLDDKYRNTFIQSSKEAFRSLPNDVRTALENSLSQNILNLISR